MYKVTSFVGVLKSLHRAGYRGNQKCANELPHSERDRLELYCVNPLQKGKIPLFLIILFQD